MAKAPTHETPSIIDLAALWAESLGSLNEEIEEAVEALSDVHPRYLSVVIRREAELLESLRERLDALIGEMREVSNG